MRLLSFLTFLMTLQFSQAQRIANFDLFQVELQVNTKFTLRAGGVCYGYKILHSTDSIVFNEVIDYPTICGASGSDEYFSNIHSTPVVNQNNFYKVQLSTFETSEVRKIFVSNGRQGSLLVYPNPLYSYNDIMRVKLMNQKDVRLVGYIYDQFGTLKSELDITTQGDVSIVDTGSLENGLFVIWLTDGKQAFSSKFIIRR